MGTSREQVIREAVVGARGLRQVRLTGEPEVDITAARAATPMLPAFTAATRPAAGAYYRGAVIYVRDVASPATIEACMQNSDDTWSWVVVAVAPL